MKILVSPAKKMNTEPDVYPYNGLPFFLEQAEEIAAWIRTLSYEEAKKLWKCNDRIAGVNYQRFQEMDLRKNLTPAILSYEGIQYQYMAPAVFEEAELSYIQKHLYILSGLYGLLRPLDGITPYRLEMQAKAKIGQGENLYEFWGRKLYQKAFEEGEEVLNLASREYALCMEKYLRPSDRWITCIFGQLEGGNVRQKATYAKMARGEMVRYLARTGAKRPEDAKNFDCLGYIFAEELSSADTYVFIQEVS